MKKTIKNKRGQIVAYLKEGDQSSEVRSQSGQLLATYKKAANETRDKNGRLIGKGNLLLTQVDM